MKHIFLLLCLVIVMAACNPQPNLYERTYNFKNFTWDKTVKPKLTVTISDTTLSYDIYFVVRHRTNYPYNNLRMHLSQGYRKDSMLAALYNFKLGEEDKWSGQVINDVITYKKKLTATPVHFTTKPYIFHLQHAMVQPLLSGIMSISIRIEEKK